MVKAIPGRKFWPVDKFWSVPLEEKNSVDQIRLRFNLNKIDTRAEVFEELPELPDMSLDMYERLQSIIRRKDGKFPFPYQLKGVAQALQFKRCIVGDEPGLGKTMQAMLTICLADQFPLLIICPSSLKLNWQREIKEWTGMNAMILSDRVKRTWSEFARVGASKIFIVNYESLKKYFVAEIKKPTPDAALRANHIHYHQSINLFKAVIIDESHRVKETKAAQSKFTYGICKGKEWVLALTGTPVVNKPRDLASQLSIIDQISNFGKYKAFMNRYCEGYNGASNLKELGYMLRKHCFYRREKKDVLKELPDKMRQIVLCDLPPLYRGEYNKVLADLEKYLRDYKNATDEKVASALRGKVMVEMGILKNVSARGKLADVIDTIREVIIQGEKIVVFVHLKEVAAALKVAFPDALTVVGDDSNATRQYNVDQFQNNPEKKVIICSIKAAGVGITLTAASRVAFVELPWHPADCDQCEDRCIAKGQLIMTSAGFKKVEDVKVGDMVYSAFGLWRKVTDTWNKLERKKAFVEIKYKGFSEPLRVTDDHRIYVFDKSDNKFKYVEAKSLDIIIHQLVFSNPDTALNKPFVEKLEIDQAYGKEYKHRNGTLMMNGRVNNPCSQVVLTEKLMFAFGWYLAEGWSSVASNKGSSVAICGNDKTERRQVTEVAETLCREFGLKQFSTTSNKKNCFSAYIYSKNLAAFFKSVFGSSSATKKIPDFVFKTSEKNIKSFLAGYYRGDGYRRKNTQQASAKSDQVVIGLCQLEAMCGSPITLRKTSWGGWSFEYADRSKTNRTTLIENKHNSVLFPIQEIKICRPARGEERVYDLTVENDESFTVGLATVHNCHRIGQKDSVQCMYFLGKETIDEHIYSIIDKKRSMSQEVTGASTSIEAEIIDMMTSSLFNSKHTTNDNALERIPGRTAAGNDDDNTEAPADHRAGGNHADLSEGLFAGAAESSGQKGF